jgi:hypothetical protein
MLLVPLLTLCCYRISPASASAGAAALERLSSTALLLTHVTLLLLLLLQGHCRLLLQLGLLPHGGRHLLRGQGALLPF